jgi:hypothetical protein
MLCPYQNNAAALECGQFLSKMQKAIMRYALFLLILVIAAACGAPPPAKIPTSIVEATATPMGQAPTLVPTDMPYRQTPPPVTPNTESTFYEGNR